MEKISNKFIITFLALAFSFSIHAKPIKHLRVIWQESPQTESYIAWTTKGIFPVSRSKVYFDTIPRSGKVSAYRYQKKRFIKKPYTYSLSTLNGVKLENLRPNTRYFFVVQSGKNISKEYYFKTAPKGNTPFTLLFGGDSRSDQTKRREMNLLIKRAVSNDPSILALVHGGDYVDTGFSWKQWKRWLGDWQLTTQNDGRILPIIPTRGNHETSRLLYNDIFLRPGGRYRSNYFKTKIGNMSIFTLNTNGVVGGPQKRWLKKNLKIEAKRSKWIVANYHRPAWPAVKRAGRAKRHWVPLFEDYQIDMAFESDGHVLKRTAPIYRDQVNFRKGITYVGEGGLGVKQRIPKKANKWYFNSPGYATPAHHMLKLAVNSKKMVYTVHLDDGKIFDRMVLKPRKRSKK